MIIDKEKENTIRLNVINEFKSQKTILEALFGEDWFINGVDTDHPAYKRWLLSRKIIEQKGVFKFPEDKISDIISIILDNYKIVECSRGDIDKFILGTFPNWDKESKNRMCKEMQHPRKFLDKMLELSYEAWHLSKGNKIIHYEKKGYPDFEINIKDIDLPIVGDCKRIQTETNDNRFGKDIYKANTQIKKLDKECYGIVVIDITEKIRSDIKVYNEIKDSEMIKHTEINKIPDEVNRIKTDIVQHAIIKDNSSVSVVFLTWNKYMIVGKNPENLSFFSFTMNIPVRHLNPLKPLPEKFDSAIINSGTFFTQFGLY